MLRTISFILAFALAAGFVMGPAWASTPAATTSQDGSSITKAIIIEADEDASAVKAENDWLAQHYVSYHKVSQSLLPKNDKHYDAIQILDASGNKKTIYFDVSKAFESLLKMFG